MKTDYRLLAKKLGECGMERKRIPHFIHLLQSAAEMFPMSDDDQKWALSKGFIPDKIDLYGLNEGNADLWVPDFDYLMMHPLNNHFKFWVDDKLTLKYMLNTPPLSDLMPEYYLYVENDGRYTYLMNMPSGVDRDEGCLSSLLRHEHALAIKPNHGMGGAGFVKLELVAEGEMAANNVIIPREEFLNLESELSGCIVTEYIRQHDDLRKIWSGSECTLRVIMAKNVGSSKYREASYTCVLAYARFGTSRTGGASNLSQGGIGVPFDFETGLLNGGGVKRKSSKDENYRFSAHPDTGVSFSGFRLPNYEQAKSAVLETCAYLSSLDYFGFDVIISQDGVKFCEINTLPEMDTGQAVCGPALVTEEAKKFFESRKTKAYPKDLLLKLVMECQE